MPFGYLEFSRAIGREPCPLMRAPPAGRCRCRAGLGSGSGSGSLPGLILFESGLRVWVASIRSTTRTRPAPLSGSERLRTSWTANGCEPVGLPKVANQLDGQRLGRKVAPFRWVQICWPLLERYIKRSDLSIQKTNTKRNLSLSL